MYVIACIHSWCMHSWCMHFQNAFMMHYALSWEFRELITRESETILPLFLSYSFLSSSLLFGIKMYKTFYWSSIINAGLFVIWHLGLVTTWVSEIWSFEVWISENSKLQTPWKMISTSWVEIKKLSGSCISKQEKIIIIEVELRLKFKSFFKGSEKWDLQTSPLSLFILLQQFIEELILLYFRCIAHLTIT